MGSRGRRLLAAVLAASSFVVVSPASGVTGGAPLNVDPSAFDRSLVCQGDLAASQATPVILMSGLASNPTESFRSGYLPALSAAGIPACTVEFPSRGLGDIQVSAEYAVHAVRQVSARAGRPVALAGHSLGGVAALWAVRFWPDILPHVSDVVGIGSPFSGSQLANTVCQPGIGCAPAIWQQRIGSRFLGRLTSDPLPSGPAYTSIGTVIDEIVTPTPQATGLPGARNIVLQDICPGRPIDHVALLYDHLTFSLVVDAVRNEGPADPARLPAGTCGTLTIPLDSPTFLTDSALGVVNLLFAYAEAFSGPLRVPAEPALMPYATDALAAQTEQAVGAQSPVGTQSPAPVSDVLGQVLPRTG